MIHLNLLVCFCLINLYYTRCYTMNAVISGMRVGRAFRAGPCSYGQLRNLHNRVKNTRLHDLDTASQEICSKIERSVLMNMFQHDIGKAHTTLLLSVSGGSDSVAMMHILSAIKESYKTNINIEIVNFNHKARPESDEEAQFVGSWAKKYDVPFHAKELPETDRVKAGFQETARDWRRLECEKLISTHAQAGAAYICTGHNSDDQNETMMLKLLRGVHLSKFQPMKVVNGPYFRPILDLSKQQIEQYLTLRGLEWREDSSNQSRDYKRNQVRLDLLPLMAELSGGKAALSARLAQIAQQSEDLQEWIDDECDKYNKEIVYDSTANPTSEYVAKMVFPHTDFATSVPKLVLGELVRRWVQRACDVELAAERIQALVEIARSRLLHRPTRAVTVCKEFDVVRVKHELQLRRRVVPENHRLRT